MDVMSGAEMLSTNAYISVIRTKPTALGGTILSQTVRICCVSNIIGKDRNNIRKKENFVPSNISLCIYGRLPVAYDFVICGFNAVIKLFEKLATAVLTCTEIPLAAF